MKRMIMILLGLTMAAVACGSDVTLNAGQEPAEPTPAAEEPVEPTAPPVDEPADEPILGAGPYPIGTIEVVVTNSETGEQTAMYTLSCLGDTATVTGDWTPELGDNVLGGPGDGMCLSLGEPAVQARLIDGVPSDQVCTEIYGSPDTAEVVGELSGQPVATTFDRSNGCGIDDWDVLMAGLLPPASN